MIFYPRILLRCKFEITEVADECIAVSIDEGGNAYHGVIKLNNEPARFMFEKLQEGISLPELIKACMDKYQGDTVEEVGPKVIAFLDQLKEQQLLVVDPKHGIKVPTPEEMQKMREEQQKQQDSQPDGQQNKQPD